MPEADLTRIFAIVGRRIQMHYARELPEVGIKYGLMGYIMCINNNPGLSQEQVAALMAVEKSSVAKAVRQLVDEGYVMRTVNPDCRRENVLVPTAKARDAHDKILAVKKKVHDRVTRNLTKAERDVLLSLLEKIFLDEVLL